jgi:hypothetical protein
MAEQTKSRLKVWSKKLGILLFTVLFLLNIKVALSDETTNGDFSLFGIEITLFQQTSAEPPEYYDGYWWIYINRPGPGGSYWMCCETGSIHECHTSIGCGWGFPN